MVSHSFVCYIMVKVSFDSHRNSLVIWKHFRKVEVYISGL